MAQASAPRTGGPVALLALFGCWPALLDPIAGGPCAILPGLGPDTVDHGQRIAANVERVRVNFHRLGAPIRDQRPAANGQRPADRGQWIAARRFGENCAALGPPCLTGKHWAIKKPARWRA